jgi:hypothetical protein
MGGNTPVASHVRKKIFSGMPPLDGTATFSIKCMGYETRLFSVKEVFA